jgi:tetratricopeptide (TPR) repeat protein
MSDIKGDPSLSIRFVMWSATARIIKDKPWTGVGAGAWEVMLPLYQSEGAQLETDYYVHNEFLQLLAEYGLTGWLFLLALFAYLLRAAWSTLKNRSAEGLAEAPMRAVALASLLALLIVSNIGFPWRLASTGCLFALCLALLGASDLRLQRASVLAAIALPWKPVYSQSLFALMLACLALTSYISLQAVLTEQKIVRAVKMALAVSQSGDYNNPKWNRVKREMLSLTRQAIAINPHYRKITPMVGDELARWGDWQDAVWVWESVVSSRPYIVAIMSNIARGYAQMGDIDKALDYLNRCEKLQPKAVSVRSLKVILLSRSGREREAASLAKLYMDEGSYDFDLVNAAWILSLRQHDYDMSIKSMELRNKGWPNLRVDGFLKLAAIYALQKKDERKALEYFRAAVAAASSDAEKDAVRKKIPQDLLDKL